MFWVIVGYVAYMVCAILSYGAVFASLQSDLPYKKEWVDEDRITAFSVALGGPVSLFILFFATNYFSYGFKYHAKDN